MAYKRQSPIPIIEGGTGIELTLPYAPIVGGITPMGSLQQAASAGTTGQILTSQGSSAVPVWRNVGGAGDLILLNTQTLSGTINDITWGPAYINSNYQWYVIILDNWTFSGSISGEEILLRFGYLSSGNTVAWTRNGINTFSYNSSSPTNTSGGAGATFGAVTYVTGGNDQGQGIIYFNLLNSPLASPFNNSSVTYFSQFSAFNTANGNQVCLGGGRLSSNTGTPGPSTGPIGYAIISVYSAGYFTNVKASLYGIQQ